MSEDVYSVVVAIGNSDDRLPQRDWSAFWDGVDIAVRKLATHVYGSWLSPGAAEFQNAAWAFDVRLGDDLALRRRLRALARTYGQDSVAWLAGRTEFLAPDDEEGDYPVTRAESGFAARSLAASWTRARLHCPAHGTPLGPVVDGLRTCSLGEVWTISPDGWLGVRT